MSLAMTQAECQDFLVEPHVGVICVVNLQSFASRGNGAGNLGEFTCDFCFRKRLPTMFVR